MGLVVLLLPSVPEDISLGPGSIRGLAQLGITSVSLVAGPGTVGLVLEGWAFDASRADAAATAVGARSSTLLRPLVQMAVSAAATEGEDDEEEARAGAAGARATRAR